MGTLLASLHPQWAAHVVIDAQTGAFLLSGATRAQYDTWMLRHNYRPASLDEVRPDLRASCAQADSCTHYLVEDVA